MIQVKYDKHKLKKLQTAMRKFPQKTSTIMMRSLNRTAKWARTKVKRPMAKRLGWRLRDVQKYLPVSFASRQRWISGVGSPIRKISAIFLRVRESSKRRKGRRISTGISYKDPVKNIRVRRPEAFIYDMPKRGRHVWERSVERLGYRKMVMWQGRRVEALFKVMGPSLHELMTGPAKSETDQVMSQSRTVLEKNIKQQAEGILKRTIPA